MRWTLVKLSGLLQSVTKVCHHGCLRTTTKGILYPLDSWGEWDINCMLQHLNNWAYVEAIKMSMCEH